MNNINIKVILVILAFLSLFIIVNRYIGKRVAIGLQSIRLLNTKVFWIIFWIIAFSYIIANLLKAFLPSFISNLLLYVGSYYIAILAYLILIFPIIDIVKFLNSRFNFLPKGNQFSSILNLSITIFIIVFIGVLLSYGTWSGRSSYVKNYDIKLSKDLKDNKLKVVLLSDIHLGSYIGKERLKTMVNEVNTIKPDVVLIAGDLIDSYLQPFIDDNLAEGLGKIKSRYGTYLALGNHDFMTNKVDQLTNELESNGVKVLRDEFNLINDSFYIVGRDDVSVSRYGNKRKDLSTILKNVDKTKPIIVIDHTPKDLKEPYNEKIDLQVSGHTHRGQFAPFNLVTSKIFELDYGYMKKDSFNAVISSGYGTWGPPIRIGSRSEIVQINLEGK
ncbi:metallophosphoesterase [Clostridium cylindrosporum]|uniref:Putative phosphohydrolase n=1 Tax=Clostridium cylindrosporum DSM 605 TaxID=1121307 RepID=A0A0J8G4G3_CLOCY|nr:metallophosphoesterase [Clostridium cylindrosporum]KMT22561.1 putative phosphohydrolase [Clostridium cylindrosporum DSM 605]